MAGELQLIDDEDLKAPLELAKNYEKLAKEFDEVASATAALVEQMQAQEASIQELNKNTDLLEKEVKKLENANKKAAKSTESMAAATELADQATGGLVTQVKTLGKQLWALAANPIGAVIAALGVALAAVATYFKSSAAGADKFEKIMAGVGAVVNLLVRKFSDFGEQIVKLFEDGNALGAVFEGLFDLVFNRIAGTIDMFTNLLKIINVLSKYNIADILSGKFSAEDWVKLGTAVEDFGKSAASAIFGIGTAAKDAKDQVKSLFDLTSTKQQLESDMRDRIISKAEKELEIEKLLFIAKDKAGKTSEQRLAAMREAVALSEKELSIDKDLAVQKERLFAANLAQAKGIVSTQAETQAILDNGLTTGQLALLQTKAQGSELEELNKLKADSINMETAFFKEQKKNIAMIGALQKEIDEEAFARSEELRLQRIRGVEDQITALQKASNKNISTEKGALENYNTSIKQKESLNASFSERLKETQKQDAKNQKEIADEQLKYIEQKKIEEEELKAAITEAGFQTVEMLGNEFFSRKQEKLAEELTNSEARREAELKAAGDDERKKLAINRKFDAEQKKIKTKQAQADKQQAIFNILINTAVGIMKSFATLGPVAGIPFAILTAAMGAIQVALVASKPLPKFAKGTKNSPSEFIAGEKGREIVSHNGNAMLVDRPTIFAGMLGSRVFSNDETEGLLGRPDVGPALIYGSKLRRESAARNRVVETLIDSNKLLKRIASKGEIGLIVDEEGFHKYSNGVAKRNERISRRFTGR